MEHLLFQLYGPMAAWGDNAVGEYRPSHNYPSKSAIMGLLAAALGIDRPDRTQTAERREALENQHRQLANTLGIAVQMHTPGVLLRDYHTTQVPPEKRGVTHSTRRSELLSPKLNTILSSRDYRCDAYSVVSLWTMEKCPYSLKNILQALEKPQYTLFLGRKSCPLALPLQPHIVSEDTLQAVFATSQFADLFAPKNNEQRHDFYHRPLLSRLHQQQSDEQSGTRIYFSEHPKPGYNTIFSHPKKDQPISRLHWQFTDRNEYLAYHS